MNVKVLQIFQDDRKDKELPHLLDIGTCGLHSIHGSFKMGIKKIEWEMKSLMKASFNILHDSTARWYDYESEKIFKISATFFLL